MGQSDKPRSTETYIFSLFIYLSGSWPNQIADQFRVFGRHIGLKDAVIVGGIGEVHYHSEIPPLALSPSRPQVYSIMLLKL